MAPMIDIGPEDFQRAKTLLETGNVEYQVPETTQIADPDRSNWIVVPHEFLEGKYSLAVDPARMSYNPAIEKAGKKLNLQFKNTSKDSLGREFIGNNDWFEFLKMNLALGGKTLNLREFTGFGNLLYQGMNGRVNVYTSSGNKVNKKTLQDYFEDIFKVRSPWRSEWLDTDFKQENGKLYIKTKHIYQGDNLTPQSSKILDTNTLMESRTPGISLDSWLEAPTKQGLPLKKTKSGNLYYWVPMSDDNSVVRFNANSVSTNLNCNWAPSTRNLVLAVRAAKQ